MQHKLALLSALASKPVHGDVFIELNFWLSQNASDVYNSVSKYSFDAFSEPRVIKSDSRHSRHKNRRTFTLFGHTLSGIIFTIASMCVKYLAWRAFEVLLGGSARGAAQCCAAGVPPRCAARWGVRCAASCVACAAAWLRQLLHSCDRDGLSNQPSVEEFRSLARRLKVCGTTVSLRSP